MSEAHMTGKQTSTASIQTWIARICYISAIFLGYYYLTHLQDLVNITWEYLISTWVFNSVYFETWWATVCYALILFFPYVMDKLPIFHKYKLDPTIKWESAGILRICTEAVVYCSPLMLLDTFMVKKYTGVGIDSSEWTTRRRFWIQHTRALPEIAPTVFQITFHLLCSFILYDFMFYLIHLVVHKNLRLYRWIHASHHEHGFVHSRVTNQLSVPERIALVLSANQALKIVNAHPLTRAIFVPLFVGWLVENHCGYDLPWTLNKVVPFGLVGGSPAHYAHHVHGSRHYQPFFTYIDKYIMRYQSTEKKNKKVT